MFLNKFLKKENPSIHPPVGLITDITDLDTPSEQSWNVNKTFRSSSGKIRTVSIYDSFPTYEDATEFFEQFGGGKSCASHPDG